MGLEPTYSDSFSTRRNLNFEGRELSYHSLPALAEASGNNLSTLPRSLLVLLENLLRHEDGDVVRRDDILALLNWESGKTSSYEIQFTPARVLLQDFTGVPVLADLAAMRSQVTALGGRADRVNPLQPVDLVIDHSVQVDAFGTPQAFATNAKFDFQRNQERYEFLKWGQQAFANFQVVPPATGICHQVNLEYLAHVALRSRRFSEPQAIEWVHPDTLVGTDSHTPMVNGLGVLGWGVGGIEAEAAMLGQPYSMTIPDVVGVELSGTLATGATATDLVLTLTEVLRRSGVVGKFVEFTGPGVSGLSIALRATLSNMAPEYGATVGFWPVDEKTVAYLELTGRGERARLSELYYRTQNLWGVKKDLRFSSLHKLDLGSIEPSVAGPARPHDRSALSRIGKSFQDFADKQSSGRSPAKAPDKVINDGSVVIAAITSCTNTSNPALMIGAALLARNAADRGLKSQPWVKTSFAPGSTAVTGYLEEAGLMTALEALRFHLVGYGCTTCIGNSGPLSPEIIKEIETRGLTVAAVLSGNRNFEARIHPLVRANYLCSPPLVIAFAIAGRVDIDLTREPLGTGADGTAVFLRDIWPVESDVDALTQKYVNAARFRQSYASIFSGEAQWKALQVSNDLAFKWNETSTYIKKPPFLESEFRNLSGERPRLTDCRLLAVFGDFITTDHISPAGSIGAQTPAGAYLTSLGVKKEDFNSYGARRGNHEVMVRGTFANIRLRNRLVSSEGGQTRHWPSGEEMSIYAAAMRYKKDGIPLVIFAGREYGSGSSRDWAAKGTRLLGVRVVVAESFERIHRSNLVGMGVLPLELTTGHTVEKLALHGDESISFTGLDQLMPKGSVMIRIRRSNQTLEETLEVRVRIDTANELRYFDAGGILPYVLQRLA